jgi:hypothetical protein
MADISRAFRGRVVCAVFRPDLFRAGGEFLPGIQFSKSEHDGTDLAAVHKDPANNKKNIILMIRSIHYEK